MEFGKSYWYDFGQGSQREWLVTNGVGGYSSLSLIGSNSRRYHGLLVSSLKPPTSRHLLLSNLLEDLYLSDGNAVTLSSFVTRGYNNEEYINRGYRNLTRVKIGHCPEFTYNIKDIVIKKTVTMEQGKNTVVVRYEIRNGSQEVSFRLTPLVNFRDHHYQSNRDSLNFTETKKDYRLSVYPVGTDTELHLEISEGQTSLADNCYFYGMYYATEQERGLDCIEDHFIPGFFSIPLKPWESKTIYFRASSELLCEKNSTRENVASQAEDVFMQTLKRKDLLLKKAGYTEPVLQKLVLAADDFIVYRKSTGSKTIIAGYPWFTDWGRDTMIAFTGLTLTTGRFEDAKEILYTFSRYVENGLIPNVFPDDGEKPAYNSVDAALWYFEAAESYLKYTEDYEFIQREIYPCLIKICENFTKGTLYDIRMTEDGLITAGNEKTQLTWMDAKVGDWVVTPRHGKAVEINALWYNGLMIMSRLAQQFSDTDIYLEQALKIKASFEAAFWNHEKQCLYDVLNNYEKDGSVRPNQILAVGLSYPVLEGYKARSVVDKVFRELYTAYGLRTLSQDSPDYTGSYSGDVWSRDGAYHRGTVWAWLLGRFVTAYVKVNGNSEASRRAAAEFIQPFSDHMRDAGIGSISEIFDGDNPHYPRGCFAQAWSIAEILRAAVEDAGMK